MVTGNLVIYTLGVSWLAMLLGDLGTALVQGALIFIIGDLIKIVIATIALPGGWALARRRRDTSV
jgi:biotin transport system substrate-specific component